MRTQYAANLAPWTTTLRVALAALTLGCGSSSYQPTTATSHRLAPEFTARTLVGTTVKLASLRGKVVILHLWAAWDCADELPGLDEIASRLSSRGTSVLAVSIDREASNLERVANSRKAWNITILHDPSGQIAEQYDPRDFPTAYVIDREGRIRYVHHGLSVRDLPQIEDEARQVSAEQSLASPETTDGAPPRTRPSFSQATRYFAKQLGGTSMVDANVLSMWSVTKVGAREPKL